MSTSLDSLDLSTPFQAPVDVSSRPGPIRRAVDVWHYRELLLNLTRKELKVKYKNSALGFVWSMLNPALNLVVFYVVFQIILPSGLPYFAIFFLAGLLPWTFFSTALAGATTSIVGNPGLVGKVWFPREILPLASIGAAMVHFMLQSLVLAGALVVFRYAPSGRFLLLLPIAVVVLVLFLAALAIALSAINVYARDTQHLLELVLMAWFWGTPIVYAFGLVAKKLHSFQTVYLFVNPLASIVITFQRAIYNRVTYVANGKAANVIPDGSWLWYLRNLGIVAAGSIVLLLFALWIFGRLEDNLAEEL